MRRLFLLLLLWGLSGGVKAACTAALGSSATFGTVTSFAVNSTAQNVNTSLTLTCDTILNLLTVGDTVTLTYLGAAPASGTRAGMQRTGNTTDTIPVMLCTVDGCSSEIANNSGTYTWSGSTLLNLLGNKTYTLPLYFRTVPGQSVAAGTYQTALTLRFNWSVCSVGVAVCVIAQTGNTTFTLNVTITVTNDCSAMSTPDVSFGSQPLVGNFPTISQTIALTCTKGSIYTVGISNGNYANGSVRNMASGNNRMSYEIYKGTTANRWGVSGTERWASTDSTSVSTDGLLRSYNYTAKVLTGQTTPPAGNYSDTLVVDVAF